MERDLRARGTGCVTRNRPPLLGLAGLAGALFLAGCHSPSTAIPPEPPPTAAVMLPPVAANLAPSLPASNPPLSSRLPPGANAEFPSARPAPSPRPPTAAASPRVVATVPVPGQRISNVDYVDAAAFFARYGLRTTAAAGDLRFTLAGGGNRLELVANDRDMAINGLRVFLGEPALVRGRAILVSRTDAERLLGPILAPSGIASPAPPVPRIIVLDPGHGGQDSGAVNTNLGVFEKTFALDVALLLKPLLEAKGWQIVLTRADDRFIPLPQRPVMANSAHADLFISIHFNTVPGDTRTTGTEIYTFPPQFERSTRSWSSGEKDDSDAQPDPSNRFDAWNVVFANALHRALLAKLGTFDRGQKIAHWAVLKGLNCPGVLIESAFLSNDAEARKVATPAFRQQIAESIANGVEAYAAQLAGLSKSK